MKFRTVWILLAVAGLLGPISLGQTPDVANRSRSFGPNACGPADPAYIRTANETGGVPLFLQRSEAAKSMQLVRESTRENMSTVFWGHGTLAGQPRSISIPVDSETQRVTFTFSTDTKGSQLVLRRPTGGLVTESAGHVEVTDLNCGRIVTVPSPEPGEWQAEISGSGGYWFEVQAQSGIHFTKAEFVKLGGRPGHEGLFRISGEPVAGEPATLDVYVSDVGRDAEFYLVSESGERLQKVAMKSVGSGGDMWEFTGKVQLPVVPFRVSVEGETGGKPWQRFFPSLFHAESVEVSAAVDFDELPVGGSREAAFMVRNVGTARAFRVKVTGVRGFVRDFAPKELTLREGQSATVRVQLTVPAETAPGVGETLIVLASSTSGAATSNSSVVRFTVTSANASANSH